jgi:hypothetical protein
VPTSTALKTSDDFSLVLIRDCCGCTKIAKSWKWGEWRLLEKRYTMFHYAEEVMSPVGTTRFRFLIRGLIRRKLIYNQIFKYLYLPTLPDVPTADEGWITRFRSFYLVRSLCSPRHAAANHRETRHRAGPSHPASAADLLEGGSGKVGPHHKESGCLRRLAFDRTAKQNASVVRSNDRLQDALSPCE